MALAQLARQIGEIVGLHLGEQHELAALYDGLVPIDEANAEGVRGVLLDQHDLGDRSRWEHTCGGGYLGAEDDPSSLLEHHGRSLPGARVRQDQGARTCRLRRSRAASVARECRMEPTARSHTATTEPADEPLPREPSPPARARQTRVVRRGRQAR